MTTRIDGSSPAVSSLEHDEPAAPPATQPIPKRDANELAGWSSPGADAAVLDIESSYGRGIWPDMEAISADFSNLDGFALLKTLNKLDAHDKLESVLNRMSVDERQKLINQAVKGNLLESAPNQKLKAKFELPASFQKMVDELNTLANREKPAAALTYNWSSYQEDAHDVAKRNFADQIATLNPGDSIEMDAKIGAAGHTVGGSAEAKVSVKRGTDGMFTVSSEVGVEAELEEHLTNLEGKLGAGAQVEYRFKSAAEAKQAAELFASSPPEGVEKYGRPAAIELKGTAAAEIAKAFGVTGFPLAELEIEGAEATQLSVRVELEGKRPSLSMQVEAKLEVEAAPNAGVPGVSVKPRGYEAKQSGRIALEVRARLTDPDAFMKAPIDYVRSNATKLRGSAEGKATIATERTVLHHSTSIVTTVSTTPSDLQRVAQQAAGATDWRQAVTRLGTGVEVDIHERKTEVKHGGADVKLDAGHHIKFKAGAGYERTTLESERTIFRGNATDFVKR